MNLTNNEKANLAQVREATAAVDPEQESLEMQFAFMASTPTPNEVNLDNPKSHTYTCATTCCEDCVKAMKRHREDYGLLLRVLESEKDMARDFRRSQRPLQEK